MELPETNVSGQCAAAPANSRALLVPTFAGVVQLVPDLPGAYDVRVEVSDGFVTSVAETTINATPLL